MKQEDFEKFREGLAGVYGFYEKEINRFALDVWWSVLKKFDLDAIIRAFNRHVANPDSGKWLPKPADIVLLLEGTTQDSALQAWAKVDKAVRVKGTYVDVAFDDHLIHRVINDMGGWIGFGQKTEDEWPFVAKEFENRYRGFKSRGEIPDYPTVLIGIANAYNNSKGLPLQPCELIGDVNLCKKVIESGSKNPSISFTRIDNPTLKLAFNSSEKKAINK